MAETWGKPDKVIGSNQKVINVMTSSCINDPLMSL